VLVIFTNGQPDRSEDLTEITKWWNQQTAVPVISVITGNLGNSSSTSPRATQPVTNVSVTDNVLTFNVGASQSSYLLKTIGLDSSRNTISIDPIPTGGSPVTTEYSY